MFNRSDLVTFAGLISGSGAVRQVGSGTTVLSGINSYAGGTSIVGGTLQVSADANLGDAAGGLIFSGGTLRTTASFASARSSSLTGAGTILTDGGTIFALGGVISGAGGLTKSGTGILTLSGNNSYAGATNVNAGTLRINGDQSAATGLVTVASGATLAGSGTIGGSVNVLNGGILAPGNSPGTLDINGDLSLAGGSILNFEFGEAGVVGGALNDLVNVGGNLTLDGTINVTSSSGGYFGGGIYRVFNYAGTLTDNGLALGSMPAGSDVTVQTSVAGQVNLINSEGLALSFWDGDAGPKFDDLVNGGSGSWHLSGADNNWTGADGAINAAYADGTFAIFAGAPGTVTVNNSDGAVTATGMQFATDGYLIDGAPLTLVGPESVVRVGDGTAAGAGFTATISADLTGASQLVKTDAGTLVLTGANSYTGGTRIEGGVISVENDSFLGDAGSTITLDGGTLRMTGASSVNARTYIIGANGGAIDIANAATSNGVLDAMTGSGGFTKLGDGSLALAGENSYTGGTTIEAGTLQIGGLGGATGSIIGDVVNNARLTFNRSNAYTYAGSITGTGSVQVASTGVTTLTGDSNYGAGTLINGLGGELRIVGGANVISGGSTTMGRSTLSVDGANSVFSTTAIGGTIAFAGSTVVNVTDGGTLRIRAGDLDLRGTLNVATRINITGANSLADVAGGIRGSATFNAPFSLTIGAGGTLRTAGESQIGTATSNTNPIAVAIAAAGSNWTSTGSLLMTAGNFTVDQGGTASFASATFGAAPQAANLTVSGAGSSFATTGDLIIGSGTGTAVLTVADGGRTVAGSGLQIAAQAGSTGTVNIGGVEGGLAAAAGFIEGNITFGSGAGELNFNHTGTDHLFANSMSGAGSIDHAAGTTRLTGDSSAFTGTTSVAGGTLLVDGILGDASSGVSVATGGTLGGTGTLGGNVAILDGNLNPGNVGGIPGRLTIAGDLNLAPAATLNVDFGQANVVGGAYNDLIDVGGDLVLGGTLNVQEALGGNFEPGVYRVINYGGTLTDNGLTVNAGYFVQTSVANQVNLVNTTGLTMRFWDGVNGGKNDGVITGGDGLWQASGGNDNWTEFDGSANAPFTDAAFAVFSGVGGAVTVDGSLGAVTASGMQFASDGYVIAGADIALVEAEAIIRVGDGSIGGADYSATIASNLTGIGDVIKTDLGTLVLTGDNSFVGETNVRGGELRLADGGTLNNADGMIGRESGEQGVVTVTGTDGSGSASTWTNTGILRVGRLGSGTLGILDGGIVTVADIAYIGDDVGSQGTVNVSGQDANGNASTWTGASDIVVGEFGSGTLNITAGGQVGNQSGWIGSNAGSQGIVNVSGVGANGAASTWTNNGDVLVGYDGNGTLNIADGGKVVSVGGQIGANSDGVGEVLVTGVGSSWENSGRINVGLFGAGTLRIENGATVTGNDAIIGASGNGNAIISGAGTSWINTHQLSVGSFGTGSMRIENGASVTSNQAYIGANSTGSVVVTGAGSNWLVTDFSMTVGNEGAGSLLVENGGLVRAEGGFALGVAAGSSGTVTIAGTTGNRGVVETSQIGGGLGTVDFSLDGGVLRATQDEGEFFADFGANDVTLGTNGGIIDTDGHNIGIAPRFAGAGGLTKDGLGTLTLTGANSYAGATFVNAGTLLVNGDQSAATGLMTVFAGATLGGTGTIGGDVAMLDGAILAPGESAGTLTVGGNLSLAGGSILNYEFGQADVAGGALNDLVNVGGDLTLDGTINVTVAAGGSFGPGIYRVFNYGGALIDNGLTLGTIPGGTGGVSVQTAIAGQVNLVNSQGLTLSFWDGAVGPKYDGVLNGGDGVWRVAGGLNNWTDADGSINADYAQDSFAVFAGAPGTVTIDNGGGNVLASGMQFASDGYVVAGDTLTLTGAQAIVQVGDGSVAGAGYTATIDAQIAGTAELLKTDAGTLVLTGANSYSGGTLINGGTVRIGSDSNLGDASGGLSLGGGALHTTADIVSGRTVTLIGDGVFRSDTGTTLTLTGPVGGAGGLTKAGAGTLALGGSGSFAGATTVEAGTLFVNGDYSAATGGTSVAAGATLGGTGTIGGNVDFASGASLAPGAGGTGTLAIGGNLSLAAGTQLDFEFGQAGVAGGALNDLVNVGGDLVLDGVLNVSVPTGGAFDVGIYRLFNYGGTLTNNGVTFGTMPTGASTAVQTSVAGQVNLVNSGELTLNFWDGAAGPKVDGVINGGDGVWQSSAGNSNWTDATGNLSAPYADGAFAVFGGTAGTVTVDNAPGAVSVTGMQFAADGYVITGESVALDGAQAVMRVGDGSTAGAGFTATIASALTGTAQLVKTDAGTLVLGGTNSYTGGTQIVGGTIRISNDANLGAASGDLTLDGGTLETSADLTSARGIVVGGGGTIATASDTIFTYNGLFSGTGGLTKSGAGTLLVTADNSGFGGNTTVAGGTLAVQGSLGGAVTVGAAGRVEGAGRVGSLVNAGVVAPGSGIGSLTVAGDYTGNGGLLEIEAVLGGDASAADRLVVNGATSGNTRVTVINRGGIGGQTVEGIKIVDVAGASNGSFTLEGDYLFEGEQAVVLGAYGYRLYKNGISTPQDGDWYLRSALLDPGENPEGPLYQPGVPVYEAYVGALQSLNRLPTLQQRVGNRSWAASPIAGAGLWGRFESERQRPEAVASTSGADRKLNQWQAQLGLDAVLAERGDGAALVGGLTAHYGKADSSVASIFGNGTIDTQGYGVGATMTWYGPKGFYVDGQVKLSWFDSDLESNILGDLVRGNKGDGQAFSLELGKQTPIGRNLSVTPQVQMSYAKVAFDRFADPSAAAVSVGKGESLKTRWGLAIDHQTSWKGRAGDTRRTRLYTVMNLSYEWLDGAVADVSGTPIVNRDHRLSGELGLGGSYSWGDDRFTLYTEVSGDTAIADFGAGYTLKGTAGFRVRF
ncbi:autotransporter outer membrane beta-barrel domain-containing protein [Sphingopyxis chilensis]